MAEEKASSPLAFLSDNAVMATLRDTYASFSAKREVLGLSNPGTVDNIDREVQREVLLTNQMFTGLRADIQRLFNIAPLFRVQHGFAMGSQAIPPYSYSALYGSPRVFLQASIQNDLSLSAWANYRWSRAFVTKTQTQIAPGQSQTLVQIDNDYTGKDFSASLKSIAPSILDGGLTGVFIGSYLQSITPNLALGLEALWQRPSVNSRPETSVSYSGRYKGEDWIASAQLQAQGAVSAAYWRRLAEKVEAGVDFKLQFAPGMGGSAGMFSSLSKEATTTVGVKYDFRASVFRGQVDSTGKLSCLLEKRIGPPITMTFAGEIDQVKQQAKVGLAISLEMGAEELMEQQERAEAQESLPIPF